MFNIFVEESILRRILDSGDRQAERPISLFLKLLRMQKTVFVSSVETAWIETLRTKHKINADSSQSDYIRNIAEHPETVLRNPSSLFILNIPDIKAKEIQKSYGVMCLSGDVINISPLIDINDIHVSHEREKLGRGWDSVLDSIETLPSNALLISDRYLFTSLHPNAGDGIQNVRDILDELLPQTLDGSEYQVTVIFDHTTKHNTYTFDEIATQLNKLKQQFNRNYPITMEVLGITPDSSIYTKLHDRFIISNYYMVEASHKLAAFNYEIGTTRQLIIPLALFTMSSLNAKSTPPLKSIEQTLTTLRDFSGTLPRITDHNTYLYAVNGQRMEKCLGIRNRLIK